MLLSIAVITLAGTLQWTGGVLSLVGLLGISVVLAEAWAALLIRRSRGGAYCDAIMFGVVVLQVPLLLSNVLTLSMSPADRRAYVLLVVAAGLASVALLLRSPRARTVWLPLCAVLASAIGISVIRSLPIPHIDVLQFQTEASKALLRGISPYSIVFHDPYPPTLSTQFYGPGVSVGGVLKFGYPYMPVTLLLALPGFLVGDVRYASLGAIVVAAFLIARAQPSRSSNVAALLLLLTPALPFMVFAAWSDTYVVLLLSVVFYAHCRAPRFLPYAVGFLFVSKQYLIVGTPLILLLIPQPWSLRSICQFGWRAAIGGAFVTLPFIIWDPDGFMHSVVWLQFRQPFRHDALSYLAWINPSHPTRWIVVPFALAVLTAVTLLRMSIRRPMSFALALGLTMLPFFAFNKQAFFNYYFFILGCLCCAIAAEQVSDRQTT